LAKDTLKGASRRAASLADIATPCVIVGYADVPDFVDSKFAEHSGEQPNKPAGANIGWPLQFIESIHC
jgi:hypothetical protein